MPSDHERALSLLREMEARAEAAREGPWIAPPHDVGGKVDFVQDARYWDIAWFDCDDPPFPPEQVEANRTFIASVRTDAPKLIAALKEALSALDQCGLDHGPSLRAIAEALK